MAICNTNEQKNGKTFLSSATTLPDEVHDIAAMIQRPTEEEQEEEQEQGQEQEDDGEDDEGQDTAAASCGRTPPCDLVTTPDR